MSGHQAKAIDKRIGNSNAVGLQRPPVGGLVPLLRIAARRRTRLLIHLQRIVLIISTGF